MPAKTTNEQVLGQVFSKAGAISDKVFPEKKEVAETLEDSVVEGKETLHEAQETLINKTLSDAEGAGVSTKADVTAAKSFRGLANQLFQQAGKIKELAKQGAENLSEQQQQDREQLVKITSNLLEAYGKLNPVQKLLVLPIAVALSPLIMLMILIAPELFLPQEKEQGRGQGQGKGSDLRDLFGKSFGKGLSDLVFISHQDYVDFAKNDCDWTKMPKKKQEHFERLAKSSPENRARVTKEYGLDKEGLDLLTPEERAQYTKECTARAHERKKERLLDVDNTYQTGERWGYDDWDYGGPGNWHSNDHKLELNWAQHGYKKGGDELQNAEAFHNMKSEAAKGELDTCGARIGNTPEAKAAFQEKAAVSHEEREAQSFVQHMINEGACSIDDVYKGGQTTSAKQWLEKDAGISFEDAQGNKKNFEDLKDAVEEKITDMKEARQKAKDVGIEEQQGGIVGDDKGGLGTGLANQTIGGGEKELAQQEAGGDKNPFAAIMAEHGGLVEFEEGQITGGEDVKDGTNVSAGAGVGGGVLTAAVAGGVGGR